MFCEQCGAEINEGAKFCSVCGHEVAAGKNIAKKDQAYSLDNRMHKSEKSNKGIIAGAVATIIVAAVAAVMIVPGALNERKYNEAVEAFEAGDYNTARKMFTGLGDYNDSQDYLSSLSANYAGILAAGEQHVVGLRPDGTVFAYGDNTYNQCDVDNWTDIVSVYAKGNYTIGLKNDGTVVATGDNTYNQCEVDDWTDIVEIYTEYDAVIGLKKDGTVVTGYEGVLSDWKNIKKIEFGFGEVFGLTFDGKVERVGDSNSGDTGLFGERDTDNWTDIIDIIAGYGFTVGLKSDGTVIAIGKSDMSSANDWTDITAIYEVYGEVFGVKSDGAVVSTSDGYDEMKIESDGTLVLKGAYDGREERINKDGRCSTTLMDTDNQPISGNMLRWVSAGGGEDSYSIAATYDGKVYLCDWENEIQLMDSYEITTEPRIYYDK